MAESTIRELFQATYGSAYCRLTGSELNAAQDGEGALAKKFAAVDIRYSGYFGVPVGAGADQYSHTTVLELKNFGEAKMTGDDIWASEWAKYVDRYSLTRLAQQRPGRELALRRRLLALRQWPMANGTAASWASR